MPDHCQNEQCVILLSGFKEDTHFVIEHIDQLKLYVKIVWFGENLRYVIQKLYDQNIKKQSQKQKSFIVVHWTPSEIVDANIEYKTIVMPECEQFIDFNMNSTCKYELMPILMYCSKQLLEETNIQSVFETITFDQSNENYLLYLYNNLTDVHRKQRDNSNDANDEHNFVGIENAMNRAGDIERIYDEIACTFIRDLSETSQMNNEIQFVKQQIAKRTKQQVYIGGIYPKKEEQKYEHDG